MKSFKFHVPNFYNVVKDNKNVDMEANLFI